MKVLHVIDHLDGGGAERSLVQFLAQASSADVRHAVVALHGDTDSRRVARTLTWATYLGPDRAASLNEDVRFLRQVIRRVNPDLAHATLYRSTMALALATRRDSRAMVRAVSFAGTRWDPPGASLKVRTGRAFARRAERAAVRKFDVRHAVSNAVAESIAPTLGLTPPDFVVIPRGRPRPGPLRERRDVRAALGLPPDAFVLTSVGREHPVKNYEALVEMASRLSRRASGLQILHIGPEGPATGALREQIAVSGVARVLRRLGRRDDVLDILAASDLYVSTSRAEGTPGAILEAMSVGLPVVAFDIPPVREVLADGERLAGHLVPLGDVDALVRAVADLHSDAPRRDALAAIGRERFERHYTLDTVTFAMEQMYRTALARRTKPPVSDVRGSERDFVESPEDRGA